MLPPTGPSVSAELQHPGRAGMAGCAGSAAAAAAAPGLSIPEDLLQDPPSSERAQPVLGQT